jgi:hypothetical protein
MRKEQPAQHDGVYSPADRWYLVKIVFQIICGNGNHKPQFEEQLRLITATSPGEATDKARQLISAEQVSFEKVTWKFVAITDIYFFNNLLDGAELFSQITETDYDLAFIQAQQLKEKTLQSRQFIPYH